MIMRIINVLELCWNACSNKTQRKDLLLRNAWIINSSVFWFMMKQKFQMKSYQQSQNQNLQDLALNQQRRHMDPILLLALLISTKISIYITIKVCQIPTIIILTTTITWCTLAWKKIVSIHTKTLILIIFSEGKKRRKLGEIPQNFRLNNK